MPVIIKLRVGGLGNVLDNVEHCWYCGAIVYPVDAVAFALGLVAGRSRRRVRDHQIPVSRGGKDEGNIVVACCRCNVKKGTKTVEEFRAFVEIPRFFGEGGQACRL